jgi:hypothetical protein
MTASDTQADKPVADRKAAVGQNICPDGKPKVRLCSMTQCWDACLRGPGSLRPARLANNSLRVPC